ncbi:MAG: RNA polymerase sigma factor [Pirellulales bacterium]
MLTIDAGLSRLHARPPCAFPQDFSKTAWIPVILATLERLGMWKARKFHRRVHLMIDWEKLISLEGPAVWWAAYRLVRNQADADECFQETFVAALAVAEREAVKNWPALLHRLATHRAIDHLRKRLRRRKREEVADIALAPATDAAPSAHAEAAELAAELRWALAQLPPREAEVFCLHELGDWTYAQIADELSTTANAIGVLLHRTRHKLRQLLDRQTSCAERDTTNRRRRSKPDV